MAQQLSISSFWKDKRVLVTGHTGFKGLWLTQLLSELGAEVYGLSTSQFSNVCVPKKHVGQHLHERKTLVLPHRQFICDIRDNSSLAFAISQSSPEIVFHLAAQSLVSTGYTHASNTFSVNVGGTLNLLDALSHNETPTTCIVATSDKVYLNLEKSVSFKEDHPLGGSDPYSASKASCELAVTSWLSAYRQLSSSPNPPLTVATVRSGNVFGGADWCRDRLFPDFVRSACNSSTLNIRSPKSVRPWLYVLEPLWGYVLYAMYLHRLPNPPSVSVSALNFAPPIESCITVENFISLIAQSWPLPAPSVTSSPPKFSEAKTLLLDASLAKDLLGWKPTLSLESSVQASALFYSRMADGTPLHSLLSSSITSFLESSPSSCL